MADTNSWLDFLVRFTVESDAIAGIKDDAELVRLRFLEKKSDGHVGALRLLGDYVQDAQNRYLTPALVCFVQHLIVSEQHAKPGDAEIALNPVGAYRDQNIFLQGRECASALLIPSRMRAWFKKVSWWQDNCRFKPVLDNVHTIADLHYQFGQTHPFAKGNGRTARALAYFMFLHATLAPFVFENADKYTEYYPCLVSSDAHRMRAYFRARWQHTINQ